MQGLPLMRVVLAVTINGSAESIIDGVTTNVEAQPGEGGVGKLVVKGKDMSALMDIIDFPGAALPGNAAVGAGDLARHAATQPGQERVRGEGIAHAARSSSCVGTTCTPLARAPRPTRVLTAR